MILLLSDLHLDDKPINEYRFDLFPQVGEMIEHYGITEIRILGDVLDRKDNHSGRLLNRVVDGLASWVNLGSRLVILHGNHDSISNESPYLYFVRHLRNFTYINSPTIIGPDLYLPHSRDPLNEWKDWIPKFKGRYVFAHVTVNNAIAENKQKLESSVSVDIFDDTEITFSGDVHTPQEMGNLVYVGSPYAVRFGDTFEGRGILFKNYSIGEWSPVYFDFPKRFSFDVSCAEDMHEKLENIRPHDRSHQIKVKLHLSQANMGQTRTESAEIKKLVLEKGHEFCGLEIIKDFQAAPSVESYVRHNFTDFDSFCKANQISSKLKALGKSIMETVK